MKSSQVHTMQEWANITRCFITVITNCYDTPIGISLWMQKPVYKTGSGGGLWRSADNVSCSVGTLMRSIIFDLNSGKPDTLIEPQSIDECAQRDLF